MNLFRGLSNVLGPVFLLLVVLSVGCKGGDEAAKINREIEAKRMALQNFQDFLVASEECDVDTIKAMLSQNGPTEGLTSLADKVWNEYPVWGEKILADQGIEGGLDRTLIFGNRETFPIRLLCRFVHHRDFDMNDVTVNIQMILPPIGEEKEGISLISAWLVVGSTPTILTVYSDGRWVLDADGLRLAAMTQDDVIEKVLNEFGQAVTEQISKKLNVVELRVVGKKQYREEARINVEVLNKSTWFISDGMLDIKAFNETGEFLGKAFRVVQNLKPKSKTVYEYSFENTSKDEIARIDGSFSILMLTDPGTLEEKMGIELDVKFVE